MTSTTLSEEILLVENLNLVFRLRHFQERTFRGLFTQFFKDPLSLVIPHRDSLHVLKDIRFSIKRGDRIALLGVNGSGKTSLCRSIIGMLHPTSGSIHISGKCRAVFETNVGVIPELTGRENARLLARLMYPELSQNELSTLISEALHFTDLKGFLDVPFENYSQGMKSRIFLSIATARSSDLLILDEVYDNADQFFKEKMNARLMNFIHQSGAVIFVSHSPDYARQICNRGLVLQESQVAFDGPIEQAMQVYDFLGRNF